MRKIIFTLLVVMCFGLTACDETDTDKKDKDNNEQTEYVKDGDVPKYFRTFGTEKVINEDTDWKGQTSYVINHTFSDGMSVEMRFFDIDNPYDEFEFLAVKGNEKLLFTVDLKVQLSPMVVYTQPGKLVDGGMNFNGLDQNPVFELNTNWEHTVFDVTDIDYMNTFLATFVVNMNSFYNENIDSNFVQP